MCGLIGHCYLKRPTPHASHIRSWVILLISSRTLTHPSLDLAEPGGRGGVEQLPCGLMHGGTPRYATAVPCLVKRGFYGTTTRRAGQGG